MNIFGTAADVRAQSRTSTSRFAQQIVHTQTYSMVWYVMVMIWYGMVWYGMVWYGMVWPGMVWYSIVEYSIVYTHTLLGGALNIITCKRN